MIEVMNNEEYKPYIRSIAAFFVLLSQTGLRLGEALGLEADSLFYEEIFDDKKGYYLKFKTWKRETGNNTSSEEFFYVNELTKQAYDVLMKTGQDRREKFKENYLFMGASKPQKKSFPLEHNYYSKMLPNFFNTIDFTEILDYQLKDIDAFKKVPYYKNNEKKQYFIVPNTHQFRVHMCTELINKGVSLEYVQKFMTHLSSEMTTSYYRNDEKLEEKKKKVTSNVLEMILKKDTKPLGNKGSKLVNQIDKFIKKNKFDVRKDLNEILEKLDSELSITPKTGGLCIKTDFLECRVEAKSNEFFCAYNVCPNLYDFFYMADISYKQCKDLEKTLNHNKKNGFLVEAEKQCYMLKTIAEKKLLLELEELENVVDKKGLDFITNNFPKLLPILDDIDNIKKEIEKWSNLKVK